MDNISQPIFIVGVKRSGTTLLRLILNTHSEIAVTPESQFITYFYKRLHLYGDLEYDENLRNLLNDIFKIKRFKFRNTTIDLNSELINEIKPRTYSKVIDELNKIYMKQNGKVRWADKTPIFHKQIPILVELFPDCKIIHIIRDPRACILSQMRQYNELNVYKLAYNWRNGIISYNNSIAKLSKSQYYEFRYEDLVSNQRDEIRDVCNFLDVKFEDEILEYFVTHKDDVETSISDLYLKQISSKRIDYWKKELSIKNIKRIEYVIGSLMDRYGYQRIDNDNSFHESKIKIKIYSIIYEIRKYTWINNVKLSLCDLLDNLINLCPLKRIRKYSLYFSRSCNIIETPIRKVHKIQSA